MDITGRFERLILGSIPSGRIMDNQMPRPHGRYLHIYDDYDSVYFLDFPLIDNRACVVVDLHTSTVEHIFCSHIQKQYRYLCVYQNSISGGFESMWHEALSLTTKFNMLVIIDRFEGRVTKNVYGHELLFVWKEITI